MQPPIHITSPDNARVKAVVRLRAGRERRKRGEFVAEGMREVARAFEAGLEARMVCWCDDLLDVTAGRALQELIANRDISLCTATEGVFRKMAYQDHPQGVLAVFAARQWTLDDLERKPLGDLWLIAVGLSKPGNLGALARSADAAGAAGLIVADGVADVYNPNALRNSTGAVLSLPIVDLPSDEVIAFLNRHHIRIVAAALEGGRPYTEVDLTRPVALVIGAEDTGLGPVWLDAAKTSGDIVTIPMRGRTVDSLNASVAGAVLMYEALRQRGVR